MVDNTTDAPLRNAAAQLENDACEALDRRSLNESNCLLEAEQIAQRIKEILIEKLPDIVRDNAHLEARLDELKLLTASGPKH